MGLCGSLWLRCRLRRLCSNGAPTRQLLLHCSTFRRPCRSPVRRVTFVSAKVTKTIFAPRLTYRDVLMPRADGSAGAAFGRIVSVSGLQRSAFPALACKAGVCRPWQARSAGQRSTGPLSLSASPLPGPLAGPRDVQGCTSAASAGCIRAAFGCTHPRLDRRRPTGQGLFPTILLHSHHPWRSDVGRYDSREGGGRVAPGTATESNAGAIAEAKKQNS